MKESSPIRRVLYILAVVALIAVIGFVVVQERRSRADFSKRVQDVAKGEDTLEPGSAAATQQGLTEREEMQKQTETEPETKAESQKQTETEPKAEPQKQTETEPKTETQKQSEAEPKAEPQKQTETEPKAETEKPAQAETKAETEKPAEKETKAEPDTEAVTDTEPVTEKKENGGKNGRSAQAAEPVVKLNRRAVVLKSGSDFDPMDYVESITDDKDDTFYLWRNVEVEGTYDLTKPGRYVLGYVVQDSDGNRSETAELTLVVTR